jgi:hypothetical protein
LPVTLVPTISESAKPAAAIPPPLPPASLPANKESTITRWPDLTLFEKFEKQIQHIGTKKSAQTIQHQKISTFSKKFSTF